MIPSLERDALAVLQDVAEQLKGFVDVVDGNDGQPAPNWAMTLMDRVNAVLWEAEATDRGVEWVSPTQAALDCMQSHGGSFVRALAECYMRADYANREALAQSRVNKWFEQYNERAEHMERTR